MPVTDPSPTADSALMAQALGAANVRVLRSLGQRFAESGHQIHLVGGTVRDLLLGRPLTEDFDFATSAPPPTVMDLLDGWADAIWDVGIRFGTVGARKGQHKLEITTYRAETYDPQSRKPEVTYGARLADDLVRRDFTVNAMALTLPSFDLVDEHGGLADLRAERAAHPGGGRRSRSRTTRCG